MESAGLRCMIDSKVSRLLRWSVAAIPASRETLVAPVAAVVVLVSSAPSAVEVVQLAWVVVAGFLGS